MLIARTIRRCRALPVGQISHPISPTGILKQRTFCVQNDDTGRPAPQNKENTGRCRLANSAGLKWLTMVILEEKKAISLLYLVA